jgi:hypothetical protein
VAEQLTQQFAACISQKLAATASEHEPRPDPQEPAPPPDAPKPIGLRFLLGALWRSMTRKES